MACTAESHRRIGIVEVMGRQSGYIALGSAYGQPDAILVPEVELDLDHLEQRVRELYDLQNDPDEVNNLADSSEHQAVLKKLRTAQEALAVQVEEQANR